jgi:HupE / UreJ protein
MARLLIIGLTTLAMLLASAASAHKPSDSYLSLVVDEQRVMGRWDIALRDLEHAIGLDRDGDGAVTWGEVKARHGDIAAYALARLELSSAGSMCATSPVEHLVDRHSDGAYAVLRFTGDCPAAIDALDVTYSLLFDLDPLHRGLGQVQAGDLTQTSVFSPEGRTWHVRTGSSELGEQLAAYLREGVWHIWVGLDHILFLLCLLLPAARGQQRAHEPNRRSAPLWIEVVKVVTSFTVAHSITLSLAALGILSFPARLVESAIAASVVFAALNNIRPMVTRRLWLIAFGFGLVHGLGFASVLADLALPRDALLLALLGFNLGVEVGQLVLVALFFGMVWALRRLEVTWPQWASPLPASVIAVVAAIWFIERAFGVALAGWG